MMSKSQSLIAGMEREENLHGRREGMVGPEEALGHSRIGNVQVGAVG